MRTIFVKLGTMPAQWMQLLRFTGELERGDKVTLRRVGYDKRGDLIPQRNEPKIKGKVTDITMVGVRALYFVERL
jgi:hypothetical protein